MYYRRPPLPPAADVLKTQANAVFEKKNYNQAILLYNQALSIAPDSAVLYGNRAAAYMKREWYAKPIFNLYADFICPEFTENKMSLCMKFQFAGFSYVIYVPAATYL